jgi:hypothetical protein
VADAAVKLTRVNSAASRKLPTHVLGFHTDNIDMRAINIALIAALALLTAGESRNSSEE